MQGGSLKLNRKIHNLHFSKNKRIKFGVRIINYPIIIIIITIKIKIFKNKGASIKEGEHIEYTLVG